MERLKPFLLLVMLLTFLCGVSQTAHASVADAEENKETRARLSLLKNDSDRKRTPSNVSVEVWYINGFIMVDSDTPGEITALTIENVDIGESITIQSSYTGEFIPVSLDYGYYQISLDLADGKSFFGFLEISPA